MVDGGCGFPLVYCLLAAEVPGAGAAAAWRRSNWSQLDAAAWVERLRRPCQAVL